MLVFPQSWQEIRVGPVDLVAGETAVRPRERDEAQAPRAEHGGDSGRLGRSRRTTRRTGLAQPGARLGLAALGIGVAGRRAPAQPGDELGERLAGRIAERCPLGLAVVREHDEEVRPRRPLERAGDAAQLAIEVAQHSEGVRTFWARVVGDLVVAEEVHVDRRPTLGHVVEDALHGHVAADDRGEHAQQPVDPATMDPRLDVASPLQLGGPPFAGDVGDGGEQGARRLLGPGEVADVARAEASFLPLGDAAHRQHGPFGVAGEQVAVAGAVVGQQSVSVGVGVFDGRRRLGDVRHDDAALGLVDPAEGRHADRRAVEDPALADAGLGRPPRLPSHETVGPVAKPAVHRWRVARSQRAS